MKRKNWYYQMNKMSLTQFDKKYSQIQELNLDRVLILYEEFLMNSFFISVSQAIKKKKSLE